MTFKGVSGFYWALGAFCFALLTGAGAFFCSACLSGSLLGAGLVFDYVSFFLVLLSMFLLVSLFNNWMILSSRCRFMILFSIVSSFLCYCSLNVFVFWVSYELSILPLLFLLVIESSYSERFIAFWYLMGYVVLTSLPLLLSIFYLYGSLGSLSFCVSGGGMPLSWGAVVVICLCFVTKIPLPPFHVWLPIVHAEASSPVSVCLSGFIMKLGVLGVFRFAYTVLPYYVFSFFYIVLVFGVSVGFLVLSCQELDGKRWLAILSLSHIILAALGLTVCGFSSQLVPFIFCLGHGVSAAAVFVFLWLLYDVVGSRNWNVLKFGTGGSVLIRFLVVASLCSVASLPPTVTFFSEVRMVVDGGACSVLLVLLFFSYLFFSGLVPLFVLGGCLSRHFNVCSCCAAPTQGLGGLLLLLFLCFTVFLVI